jgi:hypothetical protein
VRLSAALLAAALVAIAACGTTGQEVSGVVVEVTGDITTVEQFVLRLPDGTDQAFVPAPGITFHSGAAIGHLRDHMRSGQAIVIDYEILDDGTWVARHVDDG